MSAHVAAGRRQETLAIMREGIKNDRLPERMFSELFLHLSLLMGFPTMLEGLALLRTIAGKSRSSMKISVSEDRIIKNGRKTLKRIYGTTLERLLINLKSLHDIVPDVIVRDVYGRIIARPGLSLRERELVNVAVLSIQRLEQQLYSHIRGSLMLGVNREAIRSAIVLAARIARVSPRKPLKLLSSLAASEISTP